jgi:hypothetical protein
VNQPVDHDSLLLWRLLKHKLDIRKLFEIIAEAELPEELVSSGMYVNNFGFSFFFCFGFAFSFAFWFRIWLWFRLYIFCWFLIHRVDSCCDDHDFTHDHGIQSMKIGADSSTPIRSSRISAANMSESYPLHDSKRNFYPESSGKRGRRLAYSNQSEPYSPSMKKDEKFLQTDSSTVSPNNSYRTFQSPNRRPDGDHTVIPIGRSQSKSLAASVAARQHEFLETVCFSFS